MSRYMKASVSVVVVMALVAGIFGFVFTSGARAEEKYTFYVVSHGTIADTFWAVFRKGVKDTEKFFPVKTTYFGLDTPSVPKLVDNLNAAIAANPDGIAVTITDPVAVEEPLLRAMKKGIPIIAVNVMDPRPKEQRIPYLYYIGCDEYLVGVRCGERMLEEAKKRGVTINRAVIAIGEPGHVGLQRRAKGFADALSEEGIEVDQLDTTMRTEVSYEVIRSYLKAHPETNALQSLTLPAFVATVKLMRENDWHKTNRLLLGSNDLDEITIDAIKEGIALYTAEEQQYYQGFQSIVGLYLYKEFGVMPSRDLITGPAMVDKDNIEQVEDLVKRGYR